MVDFSQARTIMVDTQVRPNDVTKYPVIAAMLAVPRERYVPESRQAVAYVGENVPLGGDRWLLEPRTVSKLLDELNIQPDELVLNIAAGFGYDAAVVARLAEAVVALESQPDMAAQAETTLSECGIDNVAVVTGDLTAGCPGQAPFDVILIAGGIEELPAAIADQLREGGRIGAIFSEGNLGVARIGYKVDGKINWRYAFNASAPLLSGFATATGFKF
ncbi:protein-L-isoaspartate O-methyltransferase family protein [Paracoccus aerodenitrificans]|uniref:protein-L-isoaspartate O-methyltransferase family protein n=1 Tax=Paracoccus aerodenitrificans TaxID=3017781 RepID=UPI0022F13873|nr:protein-L-isoaspartate O-methyltransferase [Paracoccus aerodenitrificans]WBU65085.1 protein-L-isoaspartate O-methyltransferase [Paracoccus aerodenitrificans]